MGLKRTYKCESCNYSSLVAGGRTRGFENITDTFICTDCKELVDIVVDNVETETIVEWMQDVRKEEIKCPVCYGTNLEKWDINTQNCPKCNEKMKIDNNGAFMCWD